MGNHNQLTVFILFSFFSFSALHFVSYETAIFKRLFVTKKPQTRTPLGTMSSVNCLERERKKTNKNDKIRALPISIVGHPTLCLLRPDRERPRDPLEGSRQSLGDERSVLGRGFTRA